ncbi:MAG: hypothetical protein IJZ55_04120 [Lachnospiraceae bacterium]|nr:hypothetical protein [Lachnospiraceae bacterium]
MSQRITHSDSFEEPKQRFYPTQDSANRLTHGTTSKKMSDNRSQAPSPHQKRGDAAYLMHRHPMLLKQLYFTAETFLDSYPNNSFLYDAYPDYLSLRLTRDRLLKENRELTEQFLRSGCTILWLELLTDTVLSELLYRKRITTAIR